MILCAAVKQPTLPTARIIHGNGSQSCRPVVPAENSESVGKPGDSRRQSVMSPSCSRSSRSSSRGLDACRCSKLDPHDSFGGFEGLALACLHDEVGRTARLQSRTANPEPSPRCCWRAIALRHQIAVLERSQTRRPCFRRWDRVFWILLSWWWPGWRESLIIVQPQTLLRWRRDGFAACDMVMNGFGHYPPRWQPKSV